MKAFKEKHQFESDLSFEHRSGHPLFGFARFLGGAGSWISHAVIVSGVAGVLLLMWFDTTINKTIGTAATMTFGVAMLFAFAGRIARCRG